MHYTGNARIFKTEVYTWRLSKALKTSLEDTARREGRTVSDLLNEIASGEVAARSASASESHKQRVLHLRAAKFVGCLTADPNQATGAAPLARVRIEKRKQSAIRISSSMRDGIPTAFDERTSVLADASALLSFLDRSEVTHDACVAAFPVLRLPMWSSAAAFSELMQRIGPNPKARDAAWGLVRCGAIAVLPIGDGDMPSIEGVMRKHGARPMSFADATLVHLAGRERIFTVFTVDHTGFESYRVGGVRRFRIVPPRRSGLQDSVGCPKAAGSAYRSHPTCTP